MSKLYIINLTTAPNLNQIREEINPTLPIDRLSYASANNLYTVYIYFINPLTPIDLLWLNNVWFPQYIPLPNPSIILNANGTYGNKAIISCALNNADIALTIPPVNDTFLVANSAQCINNKIIDGSCNSITNIDLTTSVKGILRVVNGGIGLSAIPPNGVLIGNNSNTPTTQILNGAIVDTNSTQTVANKLLMTDINRTLALGNVKPTGLPPFFFPSDCVLAGYNTGKCLAGNNNVLLGSLAGENMAIVNDNVGIGYGTLRNNSASYCIGIGSSALFNNAGFNNIGIGFESVLTTGSFATENIGIGYRALKGNGTISGANNIALGSNSLTANTNGSNNISLGTNALTVNSTGGANIAIGYQALKANTTASNNIALGSNALVLNTGTPNIAIGTNSLNTNSTGTNNIGIGYQTLKANTTAPNNIAIGSNALLVNLGSPNIAIGTETLNANSTGGDNVAIGYQSLKANTIGDLNIGIGTSSLINNQSGSDNIAIGKFSMNNNISGDSNVAYGTSALGTNTTGANNSAVGYQSLNQNNGSNNSAVGYQSLFSSNTGNNNVGLGYFAGQNNDFNNCTLIGYNTNTTVNNLTNATAIGANAQVGTDNTISLGNGCSVVIGDTVEDQTAILKLESTNRGFLPPRTDRTLIPTPTPGLIVYDTNDNKLYVFTTTWEQITSV